MSDNTDLDVRQDDEERKRRYRNRVNNWRKANPEKAKEHAHRQYLKRKEQGKLKKVSKAKAAEYARTNRANAKARRAEELQRLKDAIEEYHYILRRTMDERAIEVARQDARDHINENKCK